MSAEEALTFLHILSALWYVVGLTAVQVSLVRAWQREDLVVKSDSLEEASHYQGMLMVPGAIAAVTSGVFLWALDYNLITTGFVLTLEVIYIVTLLVFLPIAGVGIRRARMAALQARRMGEPTIDLEEAMSDAVPLVFTGLATFAVPLMVALSVFRPY